MEAVAEMGEVARGVRVDVEVEREGVPEAARVEAVSVPEARGVARVEAASV